MCFLNLGVLILNDKGTGSNWYSRDRGSNFDLISERVNLHLRRVGVVSIGRYITVTIKSYKGIFPNYGTYTMA